MSAVDDEEEMELIAAELALGVIEGEERSAAQRRRLADPAFAARVKTWDERLAPLLTEIPAMEPDASVWLRIEAALAEADGATDVVVLKRRVTLWRGYAAAITAVAASLALFVINGDRGTQAPVPMAAPQPILVAAVAPETGPVSVTVAYDPGSKSLVVTPAAIAVVAGHDHELWVVPAGSAPVSLGLLSANGPRRLAVSAAAAGQLQANATLAISAEPAGGSPTGQPTGPIVATGKFAAV